jgi:hypothetical protein
LVNKDDPAFVGVRPHVDVNFSGNYAELDFLLRCGRKDRSPEYTINICIFKDVTNVLFVFR